MSATRFITLEGIEGVGKSTHLERMREQLAATGRGVVVTREPGGTALAEQIRDAILQHDSEPVSSMGELLLMFGARALHLDNLIRPALARGDWVLCDRFTDATYAYQGRGRGLGRERIRTLERWVVGDCLPRLTLLLDAPVEIALARAGCRNESLGGTDRFEGETVAFFHRVRDEYLRIAAREPGRVRVIDATASVEQVAEELARILGEVIRHDQETT